MFFQLVKKEIGFQLRNITFYLYLGIILLFYFSQFTGDIGLKGIKPIPNQKFYGKVAITDKTEEVREIYRNINSNLNTGDYLKYGFMINKTVKLSDKDMAELRAAADKIARVSLDGTQIELRVSYEE